MTVHPCDCVIAETRPFEHRHVLCLVDVECLSTLERTVTIGDISSESQKSCCQGCEEKFGHLVQK